MKNHVWLAFTILVVGCNGGGPKSSSRQQLVTSLAPADEAQTPKLASNMQLSSEWKPKSKGAPYQLALRMGTFSFCDNIGPQQIDLVTGHQTVGTFPCDRKNDALKNGCGDQVDIVSLPDGPYDTVSVERYSFRLHGHVRDCDRDGNLVIVSTIGEVDLIDAAANKIAFVRADLPDTVVLGSGWAAWNSQDKQTSLHLEKSVILMQQAVTPRGE